MGRGPPRINERQDILQRAIQYLLKEKAAREALTEAQLKSLRFKVHSAYEMQSMSLLIRIEWTDPEGDLMRVIDHRIPDDIARDLGILAMKVEEIMTNLSLRGELFFFKLAKHFPRHLKEVKCDGKGGLTVVFKNGHTIDSPEVSVETPDFLAKCGMIYDL